MNQDQVKEALLKVDLDVEPFELLFSGKASTRVDGLYQPKDNTIIIHNRNFENENRLMYTALHEFAHHIQFTKTADRDVTHHTDIFWTIYHKLLKAAEEKGIYINEAKTDPEMTKAIRILKMKNSGAAKTIQDMGKSLLSLLDACQKRRIEFEDILLREIRIKKATAKQYMEYYVNAIPTEHGVTVMEELGKTKQPDRRYQMLEQIREGKSVPEAREHIKNESNDQKNEESIQGLKAQRKKLEKQGLTIIRKIETLDQKINKLEEHTHE